MNAAQRRQGILAQLRETEYPLSATTLAGNFGVSRQVVVGDIALLRAGGERITSTPRGYVMESPQEGFSCTVACCHADERMEEELNAIVDQGCSVLDVTVEHPVYGQLVGQLQITSRYDVSEFIRRVSAHSARPLSHLTDGVHLHTLRCPDERALARVKKVLDDMGILLKEE